MANITYPLFYGSAYKATLRRKHKLLFEEIERNVLRFGVSLKGLVNINTRRTKLIDLYRPIVTLISFMQSPYRTIQLAPNKSTED